MSNSFYDRPPVKDRRWARKMAREANEQITQFAKAYLNAREKNDRGLYEDTNELREGLITLQNTLGVEIDLVPLDSTVEMTNALSRVAETLQSCPNFPPALLNNKEAVDRHEARQARSTASLAMERRNEVIIPPEIDISNRHSVTGVVRETESVASSGNTIYNDTLNEQPEEADKGAVAAGGEATAAGTDPDKEETETAHRSISETDQRPIDGDGAPFEKVKSKKKSKPDWKTVPTNFSIHSSRKGARAGGNPAGAPADATRQPEMTEGDARAGGKPAGAIPRVTQGEGRTDERQLAGTQRDMYKERLEEYVNMIKSVGKQVEDKIARGEELEPSDIDLLSTVMDKEKRYHRRNSVPPSSVGTSSVGTSSVRSSSYSVKATNKPANSENRQRDARSREKAHASGGGDRAPGAAFGEWDPVDAERRRRPLPQNQTTNTGQQQRPQQRQYTPPSWELKKWPFATEPLPAYPKIPARVLNPDSPTFEPAAAAAAETDETATRAEDATMHAHSTPAHRRVAPPEVITPKRDPAGDATSEEVSKRIMMTGLEAECRKVVASLRPPEKKRFNGDCERFDYESFKARFLRDMAQPGMTDEIKVGELNYYFSGVALGFIDLYWKETDPTVQFEKIMKRLDKQYGNKTNSIESMLAKIEQGEPVKQGDQKSINLFMIELERLEINASTTDRRTNLDSSDVINKIIRARIPYAQNRWAGTLSKALNRGEGNAKASTFNDFIKFVGESATFAEQLKVVKGPKGPAEEKSKQTTPKKTAQVNAMAPASNGNGAGKKGNKSKNVANHPVEKANHGGGGQGGGHAGGGAKYGGGGGGGHAGGGAKNGGGGGSGHAGNSAKNGGGGGGGGGGGSKGKKSNLPPGKFGYTPPKPPNVTGYKPPTPAAGNAQSGPPKQGNWRCDHCGGQSFHALDSCNVFLNAEIDRKFNMLRQFGHCFKCFAQNHKSVDCDRDLIKCAKCGKNHNTHLHREDWGKNE